jgi:hypothetical protein
MICLIIQVLQEIGIIWITASVCTLKDDAVIRLRTLTTVRVAPVAPASRLAPPLQLMNIFSAVNTRPLHFLSWMLSDQNSSLLSAINSTILVSVLARLVVQSWHVCFQNRSEFPCSNCLSIAPAEDMLSQQYMLTHWPKKPLWRAARFGSLCAGRNSRLRRFPFTTSGLLLYTCLPRVAKAQAMLPIGARLCKQGSPLALDMRRNDRLGIVT